MISAAEARNERERRQYEEDLRYIRHRTEDRWRRAWAEVAKRLRRLAPDEGASDK